MHGEWVIERNELALAPVWLRRAKKVMNNSRANGADKKLISKQQGYELWRGGGANFVFYCEQPGGI
jgi:hypothetical protein